MVFLENVILKPKNLRSRCSAFIKSRDINLLIDTSPDLRTQMLKNKIANIDCVFYTHNHADQTHGINDLRIFCLKSKKKFLYMPMYLQKNIFQNHFLIVLESLKIIYQSWNFIK